jgi:hypothetical protein
MLSVLSPEALSQSPWILPALPWLAVPIVLELAVSVRGFFRAWGLFFAVTTALDAWLTGPLSPVREGSSIATFFGVLFVVIGDWRFFCAFEGLAVPESERHPKVWARAALLALVVPLLSQALRALAPAIARNARATYLAYELLFVLVALAYGAFRLRVIAQSPRAIAMRKVLAFFVVQYALWSSVDIFLLADSGAYFHLFRVVPNVLYYVCFLPYVLARVGTMNAAAANAPSGETAV